MMEPGSAISVADIIGYFIREMYLEAGRRPPSDAEIDAILGEAREKTDPPLTVRKIVPFVRRWHRSWQDVQSILEDAASGA